MRIISGKYRGKKLTAPVPTGIRPTEDRVREAVFNILYSICPDFEGKNVLDVFAGTGAFGLEALSRGVAKICFIDKNVQTLQKNLSLFATDSKLIEILRADIQNLPRAKNTFDIIFSDAPYDQGLNEQALQNLALKGFLKDGALCIVETRKNESLSLPETFHLEDERTYGMAKIRFYTFMA